MVQKVKRKKCIMGLTGNFGTGKSTAAAFFKKRGAKVISADKVAHLALKKESSVYKKIAKLFE